MLKLIKCEFLKLKRKPLVFISLLLSVFMPLAYAFFLADVNTDVDAVNGVMSSLFQLSAYLLLMPLLVILASNLLFEELDNDTLKNLVTIPINRTKLVLSKMLVLLLFAVGFMAVGGLVNLAVLLFQGWEPVGFWTLFGVGIEEQFASLFDIKETEYVHYYPPRTCLYMSFSSRSSQILTYEVLEPAFEYMKKNNLELDGDIFTQIVSMWKPEEEYFNWHNIWIPVK